MGVIGADPKERKRYILTYLYLPFISYLDSQDLNIKTLAHWMVTRGNWVEKKGNISILAWAHKGILSPGHVACLLQPFFRLGLCMVEPLFGWANWSGPNCLWGELSL